jgi:hypothetical protein
MGSDRDLDELMAPQPRSLWVAFLVTLTLGALAFLAFGCQAPVVYVPGPPVDAPPPVVHPPPPPPVTPPPPVQTPAPVADVLARIVVGSSLAEATAVMGAPPRVVPAGEATPKTARWDVTDPGGGTWMVYVVLDGTNRVVTKGASRVEVIR